MFNCAEMCSSSHLLISDAPIPRCLCMHKKITSLGLLDGCCAGQLSALLANNNLRSVPLT